MKTRKTLIAILAMAVLVTAVTVVSCKKEPAPAASEKGRSTLARIKDFKRQLEAAGQNPNEKSVTYMSIDNAIWSLEALFNYTYALPDESYGQTVCCDTTLCLPLCSNDSVSFADLYVFNGQMYEAVLTLYEAAVLNNKQFIILDVEAGKRNGNLLPVELHTVQGSMKGSHPQTPVPLVIQWEPFMEDILWWYGEDHSNSIGGPFDAADTLTGMLNTLLVPKASEGMAYVYSQIKHKQTHLGDTIPNPYPGYQHVTPHFCEFYKEHPGPNDYWLNPDQMNYYYFGERTLVTDILRNNANDPVPTGHSLFHIIVGDFETLDPVTGSVLTIEHHVTAYYGYREGVAQDSIYHNDL